MLSTASKKIESLASKSSLTVAVGGVECAAMAGKSPLSIGKSTPMVDTPAATGEAALPDVQNLSTAMSATLHTMAYITPPSEDTGAAAPPFGTQTMSEGHATVLPTVCPAPIKKSSKMRPGSSSYIVLEMV